MKTITSAQLLEHSACAQQVTLFEQHFPTKEVKVTEKTALAVASVFDWTWAAKNLLPLSAQGVYSEARASAWETYSEACNSAWKTYSEVCTSAGKALDEARASAWKTYSEACASAGKALDEARAATFAHLYNKD